MYSFSQLLVRNIWLGLLFYICTLLISLTLFSNYITEQQSEQKKALTSISKEIFTFTNISEKQTELQSIEAYKTKAQLIKNINTFSLLNITTLSGKKLYNQQKSSQNDLLSFLTPKKQSIVLKKQNIKITFLLDFSHAINLLLMLLASLLIVTLVFCFIAAALSIGRYKKFYSDIGKMVSNQLRQISNNETTSADELLNITELKEGISEIKNLIESQQSKSLSLTKQVFTDPLTGLNNRNKFVHFFEEKVAKDGEIKFGVLLITRCSELQTINKIRGFNDGDRYIKKVAEIIQTTLPPHLSAQVFRLNSSDFAIILPNVQLPEGESFAKDLTGNFNNYQQASDLDSVAYTGLVPFTWQSPLGELLALADTGISVAQTQNINSYFAQKDIDALKNSNASSYGNQNWRQEIENVINNRRVTLLVQPIQPNTRNSKVYGEILARFLNSNDEMLPTASFIAMAEKLDKIVEIDKLIIETAINEINNKNLLDKSFGINISSRSIADEHFIIWLERRLLKESHVAPRLVFEITEFGLQQNIKSSKRFIDMLHRSGARITVERFGVGLTSFKFFRDLKPDFIKMDSTYTRDIDEDKNNQYFLRLMVDLAHRISINVLTESVETLEEKHTLEKLFIDGCQGYYISKPVPL